MTTKNHVPTLEDTIEIEAPRDRVWEVISDVSRLAEWSPQVESTRLADDLAVAGLGGQGIFTETMRAGMRQTLRGIRETVLTEATS